MAPQHTFQEAEFKRRVNETTDRVQSRGYDALWVTDPANVLYLTGYDAWSFYVPQGVLVVPERAEPIWIGRAMDANAAVRTTWLDETSIRPYAESYLRTVTDNHPMEHVADVIEDVGIETGKLGLEMGAYYFTARDYERLRSSLPDVTTDDATNLVNEVRLVKTEEELELMTKAGTLTDAMMEAAFDAIESGVPEYEVIADVYYAMIAGSDSFGGDYSSNPPMMPTGQGTNTPHLTWTDDPITEDDPIILELGGCKKRYHAPLARTAYVGDPPAELRQLHDVTTTGLEAALDFIEPGVTCEEVAGVYRDVISEHGYKKESRLGYRAGGGEYPPSWGEGNWERIPSLQPGDTTELRPGMTFHVIAGMWEDEYGAEVSETVQVTEGGMENFSELPRELVTL